MSVDIVPPAPGGDLGDFDSPEHLGAPAQEAATGGWRAQVYAPPVLALGAFVLVSLALTFVKLAAPILNPIMLGGFMAVLALPAYRWLNAHRVNKGLVLLILVAGMLLIGLGIGLLIWISTYQLIDGLETYSADIAARAQELALQLESVGLQWSAQTLKKIASGASTLMRTMVVGVADAASQFVIAAVLAAFLLLEVRRIRMLLQTSMRDLPYIGMIPQVVEAAVQYFFIRIRLNILTGLAFGIVLLLLGVDYAVLWGVLTVLLSFVPYIGLALAATPATLLAWAEFGIGRALLVVLAVIIINAVVENVVAPSYAGKTLRLSPAVVFISFLFWAWLLGPLGALLAMPITVLLMLTFGRYEPTRWVAELIAGGSSPPV